MNTARATATKSRSSSSLLIAWLAAAGFTGCTAMEPTVQLPLITLRLEDSARWIEPTELPRYQCELGTLICTSAAGRLTTRLCRCAVTGDDLADPEPQHEAAR